jgi:hypothetical protein
MKYAVTIQGTRLMFLVRSAMQNEVFGTEIWAFIGA